MNKRHPDYAEYSTEAEVLLKRARLAAQDRRYAEAATLALKLASCAIKMARRLHTMGREQ